MTPTIDRTDPHRMRRVIGKAEEVFGDRDKADRWLRRPTTALDGAAPLDLLETKSDARRVKTVLGRIAHGIAA